jgi:hypothetical protein
MKNRIRKLELDQEKIEKDARRISMNLKKRNEIEEYNKKVFDE